MCQPMRTRLGSQDLKVTKYMSVQARGELLSSPLHYRWRICLERPYWRAYLQLWRGRVDCSGSSLQSPLRTRHESGARLHGVLLLLISWQYLHLTFSHHHTGSEFLFVGKPQKNKSLERSILFYLPEQRDCQWSWRNDLSQQQEEHSQWQQDRDGQADL